MKENKNSGLKFLITFLVLLVLGVSAFIVYDKCFKKQDKCIIDSSSVNSKETTGKSESKSSGSDEKDKNKSSDPAVSYSNFANKMKSERSKFNDSYSSGQYVNSCVEGGYTVSLSSDGKLYVKYHNDNINSKYGNIRGNFDVADKVLSFYVIPYGQGGCNGLYFINEDGTVGMADIEYSAMNMNDISINKNIGFKNIVSVISGDFYLADGPIFVDIEGNMHK